MASDMTFRPASYWDTPDTIFANIKGEQRRRMLRSRPSACQKIVTTVAVYRFYFDAGGGGAIMGDGDQEGDQARHRQAQDPAQA